MELSEALDQARRDLEKAELRLSAAVAEAEELRALCRTLEAALIRYSPDARPDERAQPGQGAAASWASIPRTEAVRKVLRGVEEPLSPSDIALLLQGHGRADTQQDVSTSLNHLKRTGWAESVSYGKWRKYVPPWPVLVELDDGSWVDPIWLSDQAAAPGEADWMVPAPQPSAPQDPNPAPSEATSSTVAIPDPVGSEKAPVVSGETTIVLCHSRDTGFLLLGDLHPHHVVLRKAGFRWHGQQRCWFVPNSMGQVTDAARFQDIATELRGLGFAVEVKFDT